MDVFELKKFYETDLGKYTCRKLRYKINELWPYVTSEKVLGFGFALPYVPLFTYGNSCLAITPATIGAMKVEDGAPSVMASGDNLPAKNEYFDRVVMIHGMENCEIPEKCLEEAWRVLKPAGKLMVIVPNEDSLWRKFKKNPFSKTKAFSRLKLAEYLTHYKFTPVKFRRALFFVPTKYIRLNKFMEFIGAIFLRPYCGVIIIEAEKLIFAPGGRPIKVTPNIIERLFKPKALQARDLNN